MSKHSSHFRPKSLFRTIFLSLILLGMMLIYGMGEGAIAAPVSSQPPLYWLTTTTGTSLDLDQAAESAERASDDIYKGLDRTKRDIGKTEGRNEIIQKARDHASDKWQSLADKARSAQETDTELSPVDQHTLKRLTDSQP